MFFKIIILVKSFLVNFFSKTPTILDSRPGTESGVRFFHSNDL